MPFRIDSSEGLTFEVESTFKDGALLAKRRPQEILGPEVTHFSMSQVDSAE
jgi:hypothetical protein